MDKVYVVYGYSPYEGQEHLGVYSSENKAKEAVEVFKAAKYGYWEAYTYSEHGLDATEL